VEAHHTPVMVKETLTALRVSPWGAYVDCTLGEGGHALALVKAVEPAPRVLGIDLDSEALAMARRRLRPYGDGVRIVLGSYTDLLGLAERNGFKPADGVLFDLGVSSLQLETGNKGFSFSNEGRLDMRFDTRQKLTAHEVVNLYAEKDLVEAIFRFGEDRNARRIAGAIVNGRPIETTAELAKAISNAVGSRHRGRVHPATRTFQALRMVVNKELENIQAGLEQAIEVLGAGARLAVISYHSLEDRLVKGFLRNESSSCICPPGMPVCVCEHSARLRLIGKGVVKPSDDEVRSNPRSRSAKLRVAERLPV